MHAGVPVWYTAVVPLPLALPDLLERLRNGYYRHMEALQHDASTIATNAQLYNGAGSDVADTAAGEPTGHLKSSHITKIPIIHVIQKAD